MREKAEHLLQPVFKSMKKKERPYSKVVPLDRFLTAVTQKVLSDSLHGETEPNT